MAEAFIVGFLIGIPISLIIVLILEGWGRR